MERYSFKKPRQHFETATNPTHVTFDDGKIQRNLPWIRYGEAIRDSADPGVIRVEIGEWTVIIDGYNLGPLFAALEEKTLVRLRAQPELAQNGEHEADSFARSIRFMKSLAIEMPKKRGKSPQLDLGLA